MLLCNVRRPWEPFEVQVSFEKKRPLPSEEGTTYKIFKTFP